MAIPIDQLVQSPSGGLLDPVCHHEAVAYIGELCDGSLPVVMSKKNSRPEKKLTQLQGLFPIEAHPCKIPASFFRARKYTGNWRELVQSATCEKALHFQMETASVLRDWVSTGDIDSIGGGAPCVRYGFAAPLVQLTSMARAAASRCNASSLTLTRVSAMSGVMGAGASVSTRRISHLRMNTPRRPRHSTAPNDTEYIPDDCMDDEDHLDTDRDKEIPANYVKATFSIDKLSAAHSVFGIAPSGCSKSDLVNHSAGALKKSSIAWDCIHRDTLRRSGCKYSTPGIAPRMPGGSTSWATIPAAQKNLQKTIGQGGACMCDEFGGVASMQPQKEVPGTLMKWLDGEVVNVEIKSVRCLYCTMSPGDELHFTDLNYTSTSGDTQGSMKCSMAVNLYCQDGVLHRALKFQQDDGLLQKFVWDVSFPSQFAGNMQDLWIGPITAESPDGFRFSQSTIDGLKDAHDLQKTIWLGVKDLQRLSREHKKTPGHTLLRPDAGPFIHEDQRKHAVDNGWYPVYMSNIEELTESRTLEVVPNPEHVDHLSELFMKYYVFADEADRLLTPAPPEDSNVSDHEIVSQRRSGIEHLLIAKTGRPVTCAEAVNVRHLVGILYVKTGRIDDCKGIEPQPGVAIYIIIANIIVYLEGVKDACTLTLAQALDVVRQRKDSNYVVKYSRNSIAVAAFAATVAREGKAPSVTCTDTTNKELRPNAIAAPVHTVSGRREAASMRPRRSSVPGLQHNLQYSNEKRKHSTQNCLALWDGAGTMSGMNECLLCQGKTPFKLTAEDGKACEDKLYEPDDCFEYNFRCDPQNGSEVGCVLSSDAAKLAVQQICQLNAAQLSDPVVPLSNQYLKICSQMFSIAYSTFVMERCLEFPAMPLYPSHMDFVSVDLNLKFLSSSDALSPSCQYLTDTQKLTLFEVGFAHMRDLQTDDTRFPSFTCSKGTWELHPRGELPLIGQLTSQYIAAGASVAIQASIHQRLLLSVPMQAFAHYCMKDTDDGVDADCPPDPLSTVLERSTAAAVKQVSLKKTNLQADKNAEKTMKIVGESQKVTYQLSTLAANNYHLRIILTRKTIVSPWVQSFTTILLDTFPVAIPLVVYPDEQRKCIEKMGIVFSDSCNGSTIRYTLNPHFCIRFLKDALGLDGVAKAVDEKVVRTKDIFKKLNNMKNFCPLPDCFRHNGHKLMSCITRGSGAATMPKVLCTAVLYCLCHPHDSLSNLQDREGFKVIPMACHQKDLTLPPLLEPHVSKETFSIIDPRVFKEVINKLSCMAELSKSAGPVLDIDSVDASGPHMLVHPTPSGTPVHSVPISFGPPHECSAPAAHQMPATSTKPPTYGTPCSTSSCPPISAGNAHDAHMQQSRSVGSGQTLPMCAPASTHTMVPSAATSSVSVPDDTVSVKRKLDSVELCAKPLPMSNITNTCHPSKRKMSVSESFSVASEMENMFERME